MTVTEDHSWDLALTSSLEAITAAADDFGHTVHRVPSRVVFPASARMVSQAALYARGNGMTLVSRGAGHSVYGQAQSDGGIICDLTRLDAVTVEDAMTISAEAGARWSKVLDIALARGLTPPVLPDYLELSVGGTLSVGGIGGTSHTYGPLADHVRALEVVTPRGELVACSAEQNPAIFFGALGSGGSGGVITRATLPLVPAPEHVQVHRISFPDAGALAATQLTLAREGHFDYVEGQIRLGDDGERAFTAEVAIFSRSGQPLAHAERDLLSRTAEDPEAMSYRDFCGRMDPGVRLLAATGDWYRPHPWFSAFLPADAVERYVNAAIPELTPDIVGPVPTLLYPLRRGQVPAPALMTPARGELFYAFTILRTASTERALAEALASNERLALAASAAGGTIYRISALPAQAHPSSEPASETIQAN